MSGKPTWSEWIASNHPELGEKRDKALGVWVWPCTIIPARYGGVYEGGRWLAFNKEYDDIPAAVHADDVSCASFFSEGEYETLSYPIGVGDSPQAALDNLKRKMLER